MATQKEFDRIMAILRNATIPRRYNKKAQYTPDPENYKFDTLDPNEIAGVLNWIINDDNAIRWPGDTAGVGLTINPAQKATVTQGNPLEPSFIITCTEAGIFEITGASPTPIGVTTGGWYLLSFGVYSNNKDVVILNALGGTDETYPVAGGCGKSDPEYDCLQGKVIYSVLVDDADIGSYDKVYFGVENMQPGDVLHITNLEISRVAKK
jgi:hypothetical protein